MQNDQTNVDADVFLSYHTSSRVGNIVASSPDSYILPVKAEILGQAEQKSDRSPVRELKLGHLTFYLIRVGNAVNDDQDLHDVFDCYQETSDAGAVVFNASFTNNHPAVERRFADVWVSGDILLLDHLMIEPFARGQRPGLSVLERTIRDWSSGCTLVLIKPYPLQLGNRASKGPEWERLALDRYPRRPAEAFARLRAYYACLGFERLGRSQYFALCPLEAQVTAKNLDLPESIQLSVQEIERHLSGAE